MDPFALAMLAKPGLTDLTALAEHLAPQVFRTNTDAPGFALLDLGTELDPSRFRSFLVHLGWSLAHDYRQRFGAELVFVSVSRFDQQSSTRPHRDGGPDASLLLLGYEPTAVHSQVSLLDYTKAARDRNLTPAELLDCCNPAFGGETGWLEAYTTPLTAFQPGRYQILVVNNSVLSYSERERGMLGVLHQAVITRPRLEESRFIDSVLLGILPIGLNEEQLEKFVSEARAATV